MSAENAEERELAVTRIVACWRRFCVARDTQHKILRAGWSQWLAVNQHPVLLEYASRERDDLLMTMLVASRWRTAMAYVRKTPLVNARCRARPTQQFYEEVLPISHLIFHRN